MKKKLHEKVRLASVSPLEPILSGYVSARHEDHHAPVQARANNKSFVGKSFIGECVDDRHPSISGRVRVAWADADGQQMEQWLPTLQGMAVRKMDRVLLQQPVNWQEPVVFGVLDGLEDRPEPEMKARHSLDLKTDEAVRIDAQNGQPLVEIFQKDNQPVVRLLSEDINLDLNGKLKITAESIDLQARKGGVAINAEGDVVVKGEMVELN